MKTAEDMCSLFILLCYDQSKPWWWYGSNMRKEAIQTSFLSCELRKWHCFPYISDLWCFFLQIGIFSCLTNIVIGVTNSANDGENAHKWAENTYQWTKKSQTGINYSKTDKNNNFYTMFVENFWYIFSCINFFTVFHLFVSTCTARILPKNDLSNLKDWRCKKMYL